MRPRGFTLIELLVSLALLAVVLAVTFDLVINNQQVTNRTVLLNRLSEDARLSLLRISEITSQAAYIYPAGQTLTLPGGSPVSTTDSLAVLVPWESPYCNPNPTQNTDYKAFYCAFVYRVEPRAPYEAVLGNGSNTTGQVVVEYRYRWFSWGANEVPKTNWSALAFAAGSGVTGVVADSVDGNTNLTGGMEVSTRGSPLDTGLLKTTDADPVPNTEPKAIVWSVTPRLGLTLTGPRPLSVQRDEAIHARAIPRIADPTQIN